jgi:Trp operon repressor
MVNVNKKYFEEELRMRAWSRFLKAVKKSESPKALVSNVRAFLTASETTMIEKRLLIPILIEQKLSYKTIGQILDVSPVTISFVKHNLTKKPTVHRKRTSINKPKPGNESFGPLMSPTEHVRRMRRKMSGY